MKKNIFELMCVSKLVIILATVSMFTADIVFCSDASQSQTFQIQVNQAANTGNHSPADW